MSQISHPYVTTGKTIALTRLNFVGKAMSLLFNMLSRFVIVFIERSKYLLISWLCPLSTAILETPKIQSITASIFSPFIGYQVMGPEATTLVFWMFSFKPVFFFFFTFSFHPQQEAFSSSPLSVIRVVSSAYLRLLIFLLAILITAYDSSTWHFAWCIRYKLNKQGDNIQPCLTPFSTLYRVSSVSGSNHCFLTCIQAS